MVASAENIAGLSQVCPIFVAARTRPVLCLYSQAGRPHRTQPAQVGEAVESARACGPLRAATTRPPSRFLSRDCLACRETCVWTTGSGWPLPFGSRDCAELARQVRADGLVESIAPTTIRRILHSHKLTPWRSHLWLSPKVPQDQREASQVQLLVELYTRPASSRRARSLS